MVTAKGKPRATPAVPRAASLIQVLGLVVLCLTLAAPLPPALAAGASPPSSPTLAAYPFQHDHILGTSLDLIVTAKSPEVAQAAEKAILAEIDRLSAILNTYDPNSQVSRLPVSATPSPAAPELIELLDQYTLWQSRSGGEFNGQIGVILTHWKAAEKTSKPPTDAALAQAVQQIQSPAWKTDSRAATVTRLKDQPWNLDALGKSYIIDRAVEAARRAVPYVAGIMLQIGGDTLTWGTSAPPAVAPPAGSPSANDSLVPFRIGLADPFHPEENAKPLGDIYLVNQALGASGNYERFYTVAGRRYSHILDARTGKPADDIVGVYTVASTCTAANGLSTTLCILKPYEGIALAESVGAECLIITKAGKKYASDGWQKLMPNFKTDLLADADKPPAGPATWPANFALNISLTIADPAAPGAPGRMGRGGPGGYRRPYMAAWIEDPSGRYLRTLTVWGNDPRWQRELSTYTSVDRMAPAALRTISRATRPPGEHQLVWDGLDDAGKKLPQGSYVVRIEVAREHGGHVNMKAKIDCTDQQATASIAGNNEVSGVQMTFGPAGVAP